MLYTRSIRFGILLVRLIYITNFGHIVGVGENDTSAVEIQILTQTHLGKPGAIFRSCV